MAKARCSTTCSNKKIRVEDSGKHLLINNPKREKYTIFDIDGCLVTEGKRADKLVRNPDLVDAILEFKGSDIGHAADQIQATAEFWISAGHGRRPVHGCIVSTYTPAFNPTIQRARLRFRRAFGGNLALKKPAREYAFSTLISS